MNSRKKNWSILVAFCMMISILVGCESSTSKESDLTKSEIQSINKSNEKYESVKEGMSVKQVTGFLGEPDEIQNNQEHIVTDIKKQNKVSSILKKKYGEDFDEYDEKSKELENKLKEDGPLKVYIYHTEDGEGTYITFQNEKVIDVDLPDSFSN
ncbi:exported hypothetical protein [Carnobacterium maltaromaticum]|uniref:hypothetical protein n=1 Tax=Carnobacterium maltaromaticum TaxID=2751 RepID=UPI00191B95E9|nr:hypothetical protein [Carnobacterium maltaromaticum]CAD5901005.1 exported hypothetical protein [Carnobacterium maltaromaticum]